MILENANVTVNVVFGKCDKCEERLKFKSFKRTYFKDDYYIYVCKKCDAEYLSDKRFPYLTYKEDMEEGINYFIKE